MAPSLHSGVILFAVLQESRDDVTALHCKVVCLVQNGSFKEALNVMNTHSKVLGRYMSSPGCCPATPTHNPASSWQY